MSEQVTGKDLMSWFRKKKRDQYGSVVKGEEVRLFLGISYPEVATKKVFDAIALAELSAIQYVKDVLLNEGKCLCSVNGDYRILLPSENARQAENYIAQADRKLRRAKRLLRNTPAIHQHDTQNIEARIHLKEKSIKEKRAFGRVEGARV